MIQMLVLKQTVVLKQTQGSIKAAIYSETSATKPLKLNRS